MNAEQSPNNATRTLKVDGELSIYRAAELKQAFAEDVRGALTVELDLSGVTEVDGAGLQLLVSTKKQIHADGGTLRLVNHSPAIIDAFELVNLASYFGDPIVISSSNG